MTRFDDFVSTLLINITVARVKADYELTRVAQIYSEDPLLKHLSIPHMRLNNTTIKFPLAIEKISASDTKLPSLLHIQNIVSESMKHVKSKNVKLNKYVNSLNSKIKKNYKNYTDHEKLLSGLCKDIDDTINDSNLKQINPQIKHALKKTILNLIDFSNLDVIINSTELKELSNMPNSNTIISTFEMTISEEGMELTSWESEDGHKHNGLVPE